MKVKVSCQSPLAGEKNSGTVWQGKQQKAFPLSSHSTSICCIRTISVRYLSFSLYSSLFHISHASSTDAASCTLAVCARCFSNAHTGTCDCYFCQMSCWPLSPELRKIPAYHNGGQRSKMLMVGRPCTDPPVSIDAPSSAVTLQTRAFTKMCPLPLSCFFFFYPLHTLLRIMTI